MRVLSSSLNRSMRATISLKCRASTPNSSVVVTVTGTGAPSSAIPAPAVHVFVVAPVERQLARGLVRGHQRRPVRVEGEDIELEHGGTDLEETHDELVERRTASELSAAADRGRHLARVDDRAIL